MCMAQRKLSKAPRFERMFKIMEYLKRNTDRDHPTTQQKMRNDSISEYIGHKETFNRLIKDMAFSMNSSGDEILPVKDWKIVFDDFKNEYDLDNYNPNDDIDEDDSNLSMHIRNLYYNRTFSYDEIDRIIEGILSSKTLDTKSAKDLIEKVENTLTTKKFREIYARSMNQISWTEKLCVTIYSLFRKRLITRKKLLLCSTDILVKKS